MKTIIRNATVLDGTETMEPYHSDIVIESGIIKEITENAEITADDKVINADGKYVMPGLINMHVHLAGNGKPQKKQRDNTKLVNTIFSVPFGPSIAYKMVQNFAEMELYSGVTTIRTVGGLKDFDTRLRDEINAGKKKGPRILASNEGISVPGGHMAGSVATIATSTVEIREQVRKRAEEKVDLIKLMITGGVLDAKAKGVPGELKMSAEMVRAACEEAHKLGFIVAAHTESPEGVRVALENGVDSIEHGALPDQQIIDLFKERNAFVTATLSPALPYALFDRSISNASEVEQYNGNVVFEGIQACAKAALENGIPVALGNDVGCPWITQYDFWRELVYFHKYCNVSNKFALYSATLNNARLARIDNITGSIEKGKSADLIITSNNPLDDLTALRNIECVIMKGKVTEHPKVKRNSNVDSQLDPFLK